MGEASPQRSASVLAHLFTVGADHRSSPAELRERLFITEPELPSMLADLRSAGLRQAIVLSTCDRIEVQAAHDDPPAAAATVVRLLAARLAVTTGSLERHLVTTFGESALRRIFAIAASLESQVLGEPQVLGQVKAAHRLAQEHGVMGSELEGVLQAAYGSAKRIRSETAIAERPISLAAAAIQLARDIHGDLSRCGALLVGLGEMGELMVDNFRQAKLAEVSLTAPSAERAGAIARGLGAHVVPFERLATALSEADIVVTASGSGTVLISADMAETALVRRRRRPIFFVDLGVPSDVERAVEQLDGAFRYDLDDLERMAMTGRATREEEARSAWTIVDQELALFCQHRAERAAVPAIAALRRRFEAERTRALREAGGDAARATELLINRLLHAPSETLRRLAAQAGSDADERARLERLIGELFRLEDWDKSSARESQDDET